MAANPAFKHFEKSPYETKLMRLVSDIATLVQMFLAGFVVLSPTLYLPAMIGLIVSGVAGLVNSIQRLIKLHRILRQFKENYSSPLYDHLRDIDADRVRRDVYRHYTKLVLIEVPCIILGILGLVAFAVIGPGVIEGMVLLTTGMLTLAAGLIAAWYGYKFLMEPKEEPKEESDLTAVKRAHYEMSIRTKRGIKFGAALLIFAGSLGGFLLSYFLPEVVIAAGAVLIATGIIMGIYFAYNTYQLRKKMKRENAAKKAAELDSLAPITQWGNDAPTCGTPACTTPTVLPPDWNGIAPKTVEALCPGAHILGASKQPTAPAAAHAATSPVAPALAIVNAITQQPIASTNATPACNAARQQQLTTDRNHRLGTLDTPPGGQTPTGTLDAPPGRQTPTSSRRRRRKNPVTVTAPSTPTPTTPSTPTPITVPNTPTPTITLITTPATTPKPRR